MLLDEPTPALDPELVRGTAGNSRPGQRRHDHGHGNPRDEFRRQISSQVKIKEAGQIAETGAPATMLQVPATDHLRQFLKPWFNRSLTPRQEMRQRTPNG
ncbi:hypothetical protein [Pseudomonas aeruginosa]|uniref:hypothetical protein n=1 Tax=Pseudomonas aeruginosa TaxID=287 RepID=UPI003C2F72FE